MVSAPKSAGERSDDPTIPIEKEVEEIEQKIPLYIGIDDLNMFRGLKGYMKNLSRDDLKACMNFEALSSVLSEKNKELGLTHRENTINPLTRAVEFGEIQVAILAVPGHPWNKQKVKVLEIGTGPKNSGRNWVTLLDFNGKETNTMEDQALAKPHVVVVLFHCFTGLVK